MTPRSSYRGAPTTANSSFMVPSALKSFMEPAGTTAESAAGTSATDSTEERNLRSRRATGGAANRR
ncbi:hypothetical protein FRC12_014019 [Ceratobasidium sp. 428]|nr:hypothetical protein FRC12_014019 [Ceratobasidium sp. 428]